MGPPFCDRRLSRSPWVPCIRSPDPLHLQSVVLPSGQSNLRSSDSSVSIRPDSVHQQSQSATSGLLPLQHTPFHSPLSLTWRLLEPESGRQRSTAPSSTHSRPSWHWPES